jgi:hypothetical protein
LDAKYKMTTENLLIAVVAAIIGVFVGHRMTISMSHERTKSLKKAFYTEFEIILDDFKNHIVQAIDEYKNPLRNEYESPQKIDMCLIESIMVELASTEKIVSPPQRRFIAWLKTTFQTLTTQEAVRDIYIMDWLKNSELMDKHKKMEIGKNIQLAMPQMLFAMMQVIYGTEKLTTEKENFTLNNDDEYISYAKTVCHSCNIDFEEEFWKDIIKQVTGK